MIETAFHYFELATKTQQGTISETLYALCIEIILKSFNSTITKNHGSIDERYKFQPDIKNRNGNNHDLSYLLEICPDAFKKYLCPTKENVINIEKYKNHFTQQRYIYEANANGYSSDTLRKLSAEFLMRVIYLYRSKGCHDPFIQNTQFDATYAQVLSTHFIVTN